MPNAQFELVTQGFCPEESHIALVKQWTEKLGFMTQESSACKVVVRQRSEQGGKYQASVICEYRGLVCKITRHGISFTEAVHSGFIAMVHKAKANIKRIPKLHTDLIQQQTAIAHPRDLSGSETLCGVLTDH